MLHSSLTYILIAMATSNNNDVLLDNNCASSSFSSWDSLVEDLIANDGYAIVPLLNDDNDDQQQAIARGFQCGRLAFEAIAKQHQQQDEGVDEAMVRCIGPADDSAHATGYHRAASANSMSSRYNAHREGFVFSDGNLFSLQNNNNDDKNEINDDDEDDFEASMKAMQECLHRIANQAVEAIEQHLDLPTDGWFRDQFQHEGDYSQWHLKRYVEVEIGCDSSHEQQQQQLAENNSGSSSADSLSKEAAAAKASATMENETILLPSHTDPSLLSVVILDQPGIQPGAMGLEVLSTQKLSASSHHDENMNEQQQRAWTEIPYHGHDVAVIFIGSVLSHILGNSNYFPSGKHRVVQKQEQLCTTTTAGVGNNNNNNNNATQQKRERMAATFFLRPKGSAILQVPPSPRLEGVSLKKKNATFDDWNSRVSRNYMKQKQKQKQKNQTKEKN